MSSPMSLLNEQRGADGDMTSERRAFLDRVAAKKEAMYGGLDGLSDASRLMQNAARVAERIRVVPQLLDHLYANRSHGGASRADWEAQVRLSTAIHSLTADHLLETSIADLAPWIDHAGTMAEIGSLGGSAGRLLLAFHSGYVIVLRKLFDHAFPNGFMVGERARSGRRDVLFGGLRALMDGRTVFIAPDSGLADQVGRISVLGAECPVALGAAFLAFETRAETGFVFVRRRSAGLGLVVESGPRRAGSESFAAFQDRLHGFYAGQIERVLTGDPRDLVLGGRWTNHFNKVLISPERIERHRLKQLARAERDRENANGD